MMICFLMEEMSKEMKILKFMTKTCMNCKILSKVLSQLDVEVEDIDASEDIAKVDEYNICTTPTLIFLDDEGKEFSRTTGPVSKSTIEEILELKK